MRYFLIFFILFSLISARLVFAQDQCAISLKEAEDKYDLGRLYEIPELIQPCLEDGFTKEEKIRAYRLLTLTYLFLDYYEKADESYLELLTLSPEYNTNDEIDPVEIINHHNKFTTKPLFYITPVKIGFNFSFANVLLDYSLSQGLNGSEKYSSIPGFHIGFGGEMVIYGNFHLSAELFVSRKNLHLTDSHWDFYNTNLDINHTEFELPVMLKYNFFRGKINPFISGGVSPGYLFNASVRNIKGNYNIKSDIEGAPDEEFPVQPRPELNTSKMKNRFNYSLLFGGGINYKIGINYLVFEARYSIGMLNVTNEKNRWNIDQNFPSGRDLKFPPGHVDDDFKINNLSFLVGFVKPLYKPRKIK